MTTRGRWYSEASVERILAARLAEAEQAAEQRERERWVTAVEALAAQVDDEAQTHWYRHNEAADDGDLDRANREGEVAEVFDQTHSALRALVARFTENGEGVRDASVTHQQRDGGGSDE